MVSCKDLCRLCLTNLTKYENRVENIFKYPNKTTPISDDILVLMDIPIIDRALWPTKVCMDCIKLIDKLKSFKVKIKSSQEKLIKLTAEPEVLIPLEEHIVVASDTLLFKEENESEEICEDILSCKEEIDSDEITEETLIEEIPVKRPRGRPRGSGSKGVVSIPIEEQLVPETNTFLITEEIKLQEAVNGATSTDEVPLRRRGRPPSKRSLVVSYADTTRAAKIKKVDKSKSKDDTDDEWSPQKNAKKNTKPKKVVEEKKIVVKKKRDKMPLENILRDLNVLICGVCKFTSDTFVALSDHMNVEHKIPQANIVCCNKQFTLRTIYDHARYHEDNQVFMCELCGKELMSGSHKKEHLNRFHEPNSKHNPTCDKCDRAFFSREELRRHIQKHDTNPFQCEEENCKEMFPTEVSLNEHIGFDHNNIPRHICDICGKGCKTDSLFTAHMKLHTQKKTVQECDVCHLLFVDMKAHMRKVHGKIEQIACAECGRVVNKRYISDHMARYHTPALSLPCIVCNKIFKKRYRLQMHMNIHLGIRFKCFFCDETYGETSNRLKHMQRKHTEEYAEYNRNLNFQKVGKYTLVSKPGKAEVPAEAAGSEMETQ